MFTKIFSKLTHSPLGGSKINIWGGSENDHLAYIEEYDNVNMMMRLRACDASMRLY